MNIYCLHIEYCSKYWMHIEQVDYITFIRPSYPNRPLEQRMAYLFCTVSWVCGGGCACSPSLRQQSYLNCLYAQAQHDMRCYLLDLIQFPDRQN